MERNISPFPEGAGAAVWPQSNIGLSGRQDEARLAQLKA